jgi:hypothetical protein
MLNTLYICYIPDTEMSIVVTLPPFILQPSYLMIYKQRILLALDTSETKVNFKNKVNNLRKEKKEGREKARKEKKKGKW